MIDKVSGRVTRAVMSFGLFRPRPQLPIHLAPGVPRLRNQCEASPQRREVPAFSDVSWSDHIWEALRSKAKGAERRRTPPEAHDEGGSLLCTSVVRTDGFSAIKRPWPRPASFGAAGTVPRDCARRVRWTRSCCCATDRLCEACPPLRPAAAARARFCAKLRDCGATERPPFLPASEASARFCAKLRLSLGTLAPLSGQFRAACPGPCWQTREATRWRGFCALRPFSTPCKIKPNEGCRPCQPTAVAEVPNFSHRA